MALTTTDVQNILDNFGYQWQQNKAMGAATNGTNLSTGADTIADAVQALSDRADILALLAAFNAGAVARADPKLPATSWAAEARALNTHLGGLNAYLIANPTVKLTTNAAELLTALNIAYPAESVDGARTDAA